MAAESLLSKYRSEIMGASALGVILCHAVTSDVQLPQILVRLLVFFNLGVDVFLFVSGFGMYFSMNRVCDKKDVILWYKKRFVRILVPYGNVDPALPYTSGIFCSLEKEPVSHNCDLYTYCDDSWHI